MIPMSKVNWGPTDACARDNDFSQKWYEQSSAKKCLQQRNWLVTGEKGSGKSALGRAIQEVYGHQYIATPVVDFNDISFIGIHKDLVELAKTANLSKTLTLSNYWQYAIIVELIKAASKAAPERYQSILDRLPTHKIELTLTGRLLELLQDAWNKIDDFTGGGKKRKQSRANLLSSGGLSADLLSELGRYPLADDFVRIRNAFFRKLEKSKDRIVLILDGFDRLNTEGAPNAAIRLIFTSLIEAVQSIHVDRNLPPGLEIKAFIPHDRFLAITLRDADKVDAIHAAIRWNRGELQEFLRKRLELTPGLRSGPFHTQWRQVMPETISNAHYRLEEDSFDYILRHTMMRPRQLQVHLEHLASEHHDQIVDPSRVPKAVAESSKKVAWHFIMEFRTEHPHLDGFISSLKDADNVMEFSKFRKLIEDAIIRFHRGEAISVAAKVDAMYGMGFFGVLNFVENGTPLGDVYCPPTRESRRHYVDFFYKNPHPAISSTLRDESLVALHPIFVDYANLRAHPHLIIG